MSNKPFQKFIGKKESGAQKKERIRQEKKKIRQETQAYFEKKKEEKRLMRAQGTGFRPPRRSDSDGQRPPQDFRSRGNDKPQAPAQPIQKRGQQPQPVRVQKPATVPAAAPAKPGESKAKASQMPLNKFIAHSGVCSRRDAADIVKSGKVFVNGQKIIEPGFKVSQADEIKVNGKKITVQRNLVYILLNKPKDFITTTEDPQGRKTVLDIVKSATTERVYPIGRLDRNTTGVLLLTNDGELAQKLAHPSYEIKKIYEVTLDRQLSKKDFDALAAGITLEDGFIQPDALAYPDPKNKHIIGIEIHSGRNRIVRRIFEHLGYDVRNLDRVMYANLTKKNVERGKWRFLSEKEVRLLKFLNNSYKRKPAQ
jgi:23S rRNA pseudouridine2605 synthase